MLFTDTNFIKYQKLLFEDLDITRAQKYKIAELIMERCQPAFDGKLFLYFHEVGLDLTQYLKNIQVLIVQDFISIKIIFIFL